jgi:hypothetical protein
MLKMSTMVVFMFMLNVRDLLEATLAITVTKLARQLVQSSFYADNRGPNSAVVTLMGDR